MSDKKCKVPKLRFPGFTDEWERRKFADVFQPLQNNSLSRAELNYDSGSVKNIHYGDILIKFREVIDVNQAELPFISNDEFNIGNTSLIQNGDVIMADAAEDETVGKCCEIKGINDVKVVSGLHTIPCRPSKEFASGYLGYFMNSHAYHDQLLPLIQGTKISSISKSALQDTHIVFPHNQEEQSEISDYFHNLDNLITLHKRKSKNLQKLKKGLLQKMFPKNKECVPELRFPGFTDTWEQRKLGEVFEQTTNFVNPSEDEIELWSLTVENGLTPKSERYNRAFLVKKDANFKEVRPGDIVYNPMNMTLGAVGYNGMAKSVAVSGYYTTMIAKKNNDPYYINIWLKSPQAIYLYMTFATGSLIEKQRVQFPTLSIILTTFPSYEEQKKVGHCFESLDNLITLHQRKLEHLEDLKKGLLQQMFI